MRAKKLDELPQLWNVLCGTMSLVGPRPEVPEYVADWPTDVCQEILSLRPGLTDPTALRFLDEQSVLAGAQNPELFYREILTPIKLTGYVAYVRERTLAKDLSIILATLVAAVRVSGRGHD